MPNQTKRYIVLETVASAEKQPMIRLRCINPDRPKVKPGAIQTQGFYAEFQPAQAGLVPVAPPFRVSENGLVFAARPLRVR
ncbi:MAG: hypothetical protein GDA56_25915 [Hormoscilla sp. GM7CHS1pb]|nr:hypothetical protein [Hormoscilla sp. GM7CHS1pb]